MTKPSVNDDVIFEGMACSVCGCSQSGCVCGDPSARFETEAEDDADDLSEDELSKY